MEKKLFIGSIFSIVGGALILACGIYSACWTLTDFEGILDYLSLLLPQPSVEFWEGVGPTALAIWYAIFGIVFGALMILGGGCGLKRKGKIKTWGITVVVLSLLSFFSGGGFWIGILLGIIGGILLLVSKPSV